MFMGSSLESDRKGFFWTGVVVGTIVGGMIGGPGGAIFFGVLAGLGTSHENKKSRELHELIRKIEEEERRQAQEKFRLAEEERKRNPKPPEVCEPDDIMHWKFQ